MKGFTLVFHVLTLWIFLGSIYGSLAALKTYYVEELCEQYSKPLIDMKFRNTGILTSASANGVRHRCTIRLLPKIGSSVVLSIYKYDLDPEDELIIEDADHFQVALLGSGEFTDERKSFLSHGSMYIRYIRNGTFYPGHRLKFQFVFTEVHDGTCYMDEFKCRNQMCIQKNLLCDRHNHCGDNSDQENCGYKKNIDNEHQQHAVKYKMNPWIISIIVASVILFAVIIAFIVVVVRTRVTKKKQAADVSLPTVASSVPQNPVGPSDVQSRPSVFAQIRRSFRSPKSPNLPMTEVKQQKSESYQVPSMYPHIPSAPEFPGVDNPEFKPEE